MQRVLERPIFIIGCPRSGTTLLFSLLSHSEHLWSLHSESHHIWELVVPIYRQGFFGSNRATAEDATPGVRDFVTRSFLHLLKPGSPELVEKPAVRMVEKTPRNVYRVPFLRALFPDAAFVFLTRDGRDNISSLMEGWKHPERFGTWDLPPGFTIKGYQGRKWCFALPPGWEELNGCSLAEVCAYQWTSANEAILASLAELPPSSFVRVRYEDLFNHPYRVIEQLAAFLDIPFTGKLREAAANPPVVNTTSPPKLGKWRDKHFEEISAILPKIEPTLKRLGYPASEDRLGPSATGSPFEPLGTVPHHDRVAALHIQAQNWLERGKWWEAIRVLDEAHRLIPESADTLFNLGFAFFEAGDYCRSLEYWNRLIAQGEIDGELAYFMATAILRLGEVGLAKDLVRFAISRDPGNGPLRELAGRLALESHVAPKDFARLRTELNEFTATTLERFKVRNDLLGSKRGFVFVVLGMHRSGTSAVSGVLHQLGIQMGKRLMPPSPDNPKGYFEDLDFVGVNEGILRAAGGAWDRPPDESAFERIRVDISGILEERNTRVWGFKDPRTVLTYGVLRTQIENLFSPIYIFVHRPSEQIVKSLVKRGDITEERAIAVTEEYLRRLSRWERVLPSDRQIHYDFSVVVKNPEAIVRPLSPLLGFRPEEEQRAVQIASEFLDPNLKHH